MFGYFSTWGRMPGAAWIERPEVHYLSTEMDIPFLNRVLRTRLPETDVDERIDRLLAEFARLPHFPQWQVGPTSSPRRLARSLRRHGFAASGGAPGMACRLSATETVSRQPSMLRIESVEGESALRDWIRPIAPEIGLPPETIEGAVHARTESRVHGGTGFLHFLGRVQGQAVASASLYLRSGVAGIYDVATLPEWRRRGIASAMTSACLNAARATGCPLVILQASHVAVPMYRHFGFRRCCTLRIYERR